MLCWCAWRDSNSINIIKLYYTTVVMSYQRLKSSCLSCKRLISANLLTTHVSSKSCQTYKQPNIINGHCRFCNLRMAEIENKERGNHVKWCKENPERGFMNGSRQAICNQMNTPAARSKAVLGIKAAHASGRYDASNIRKKNKPRHSHSIETKAKLSKIARESKHRRICKRTHQFVDKRGRVYKFDSSWEDALATRLDELDIEWTRPHEPIPYILNGKQHHYFPDFFLPDYDVYLDPKNSFVMKQQLEKITIISNSVKLICITSLNECKSFSVDYMSARLDSNQH